MAKTDPFENHVDRYDRWFEDHRAAYLSELRALRGVLPAFQRGVEIGVGTGRFAAPLGIHYGVEPARAMRPVARRRGVRVLGGVAEALPLRSASFDLVLIVTTICFVDDPNLALAEVRRVLVTGGHVLVGFVDQASPLGRTYERKRADSPFYRVAHFYSAAEVLGLLANAGFREFAVRQTLFHPPDRLPQPDVVREGHGEGGFVVVRARR